jgi:HSP20 family protein
MMNDFSVVPSSDWGWSSNLQPMQSLTKDLVPIMSTDLIETDQGYNVHVDLPGVDPNDLDISIVDKFLVIKAERKQVHEHNSDKVHSMERSFGKVQRRICLPTTADIDHAESKFKNGVLSISFPKKENAEGDVKKLRIDTA